MSVIFSLYISRVMTTVALPISLDDEFTQYKYIIVAQTILLLCEYVGNACTKDITQIFVFGGLKAFFCITNNHKQGTVLAKTAISHSMGFPCRCSSQTRNHTRWYCSMTSFLWSSLIYVSLRLSASISSVRGVNESWLNALSSNGWSSSWVLRRFNNVVRSFVVVFDKNNSSTLRWYSCT